MVQRGGAAIGEERQALKRGRRTNRPDIDGWSNRQGLVAGKGVDIGYIDRYEVPAGPKLRR